MVRLSDVEIAGLKQVAREIRDTADESGYHVDVAVGQHRAFGRSKGPASSLERSLILDAAAHGAEQAGLGIERVSGSLDILTFAGDTLRRFRVKKVTIKADGELEVICGAQSTLISVEPDSLYREEKWILGYSTSDEHTIDRLIAAEIRDWRGEGPYRLIFGTVVDLSENPMPRSFTSADEDLEGFEGEEGEAGDADAV
jgi:hypothetical protein